MGQVRHPVVTSVYYGIKDGDAYNSASMIPPGTCTSAGLFHAVQRCVGRMEFLTWGFGRMRETACRITGGITEQGEGSNNVNSRERGGWGGVR